MSEYIYIWHFLIDFPTIETFISFDALVFNQNRLKYVFTIVDNSKDLYSKLLYKSLIILIL